MKHRFRMLHLFCGVGGAALGTAAAGARFGDDEAAFENVGGVDVDELACVDFERLTQARALCADIATLTPAQLRKLCGRTAPDAVMSSPPCKGFSGLLGAKRAAEEKYQAMNRLLLDALWLVCSTWAKPPALIFFENVPRIASRGAHLVDQATQLLQAHGYSIHTGSHDCGELGGLAQHRRRWFMLARHRDRVPQFVYQPPKHRVRACGEVIGPLPMPGDVAAGGAMHTVPRLSWRNWVRLALIPAGGDWRDLPGVVPEGKKRREVFRRDHVTSWDGPAETVTGPGGSAAEAVADPRARDWYANVYRVTDWDQPAGTVTGAPKPSSGSIVVADPRLALGENGERHWNKYAVAAWDKPARTVTGTDTRVGSGAPSVADPRTEWFRGTMGVQGWDDPAPTITGNARPSSGSFAVADPRANKPAWQRVAGVTPWSEPAPTVTAGAKIHAGAFQIADPRVDAAIGCAPRAGAYRVLRWDEAAATITGSLAIDNGAAAVADPRLDPDRPPPFTPIIIAADGTWHRPLTTLELAALQGFPVLIDGVPLVFAGSSHTRWREAIGNAVPPPAALAVGEQLLRALLLSKLGAFALDSSPIWVAPPEAA